MRELPEWIGKTDDQAIPARVQDRVFQRYGRICQCGCGLKIVEGDKWDCDHKIALCNGGKHIESNLQPMLKEHHKRKTRDDIAIKSYNYRRRLAHAGIKRRKSRPMPFGKADHFKKKVTGEVVARRLHIKW